MLNHNLSFATIIAVHLELIGGDEDDRGSGRIIPQHLYWTASNRAIVQQ
jgi:hypothetical protein